MTTGLQPGWFPDPDDPTARRYWDGASWSAPLSAADASAATGKPPVTCAIPTCKESRFNGEDFCLRHGPMKRASATTPPATSRPAIVCPHCQVKGQVATSQVKQKKGISGAKATGAVLSGGLSILGTGLSRKEKVTQMHCRNCGTTWTV